jgi:hypothetical protein
MNIKEVGMDILEAKLLKKETEGKIISLLENFIEKTGADITGVDVRITDRSCLGDRNLRNIIAAVEIGAAI